MAYPVIFIESTNNDLIVHRKNVKVFSLYIAQILVTYFF